MSDEMSEALRNAEAGELELGAAPRSSNGTITLAELPLVLRLARALNGWTQEELAARLGYESASPVSAVERGEREPTVEFLRAIARELRVAIVVGPQPRSELDES